MVLTGIGWAFIVSGLNGTAQATFPVEIRGKAISVYLMAMYGGTTSGSWTWGLVSTSHGVPYTFVAAATMLLICAWALKRLSIA
jgi:predicted MFS family arabinose efflux permease